VYFFVKTDNPRPTFHLDMTPAERETMTNHVAYWTELAREGISIVFGPVADPQGFYGIGINRVDDEAHLRRLLADDPANGLLRYQITPMADAVVGPEVRYPDLAASHVAMADQPAGRE
jgi:uncharacterized protein